MATKEKSSITLKQRRERNLKRMQLATDLNLLKFKAGQLQLFKTMHAIDEATKTAGWEMAETNQA